MSSCAICEATNGNGLQVCPSCASEFTDRLAWLDRIGLPALQAVAYRQVNLDRSSTRVARTTADSQPPIDETALDLYREVEQWLQHLGGRIGLTPIGWDRDGQPVSVHDWAWLIPHLIGWSGRIWKQADISDWAQQLTRLQERVSAMSEPREERRLIGVCPTCLPETRTPILADPDTQYAVCPACGTFLTLRDVRAAYLTSAGVLHITRTQSGAAKWVQRNLGVHVRPRDLMNARQQGRIHPRHIEGRYWEWDLIDLLAVANRKQAREEGNQ